MKTYFILPLIALLPLLSFCKKEFDTPPVKQASDGNKISIAQIKAKYFTNINYKFKSDSNLYCVVTADEVSGNFYKEVYVRDASGALHVKLKYSGGLYIGDSIRINLKGIVLNAYSGLIQLDSVDLEKNVVKLASGLNPTPIEMSLQQILSNTSATNMAQSQLVKINQVEFIENNRGVLFADPVNRTAKNLGLYSCSGHSISLRTSGYANFAAELSPKENGYLIAIVGQYGEKEGDMQLSLRQLNDISMQGDLCASNTVSLIYLKKDFNDNSIVSGSWTQQKSLGNILWSTSSAGSAASPYAKISNYVSGTNQECETWLISPPLNLSASTKPILSFRNAYNYEGPILKLYVSTNYTSGLPNTATWIEINFTHSGGNWNFVSSGTLNLSAYKTDKVHFAFQYTGSSTNGSTWEIDDVLVKEEE